MAGARTCAQTGTGCGGYQYGLTSFCQYPAYGFTGYQPYQVGYAMWQLTPGECRYAMKAAPA